MRTVPGPGQVIIAQRLLVGWWDGRNWQPADPRQREVVDAVVPLVLGSRYTFVSVDGARLSRTLGTSTSDCIAPEPVFVDVPADVNDMVGVAEGVEPLPRPVAQIAAAPEHQESVRTWLAGEGVVDPEVSIDRVTRTDLEGDGVDEVLIEASRVSEMTLFANPAGDYSIVLLRYLSAGKVDTVLVRGDVITEAEANADGPSSGVLGVSQVLAAADLDGDSSLEVVVSSRYYEGSGVSLNVWDGVSIREVLVAGCGA